MQQRFQVLVKQNAKKQHKTIRVMHLRKVFKCFFWWGNNCWRHHVLSMERRVLVQNKVINDQKFIKVIERFLNWILKWLGNQCNPARLKTNNYLCLMFVRGLSAAFSYWCRVVTAVTTFTTYKHHKQARITHCEVKGHDLPYTNLLAHFSCHWVIQLQKYPLLHIGVDWKIPCPPRHQVPNSTIISGICAIFQYKLQW